MPLADTLTEDYTIYGAVAEIIEINGSTSEMLEVDLEKLEQEKIKEDQDQEEVEFPQDGL
jgi:hypothetical protein